MITLDATFASSTGLQRIGSISTRPAAGTPRVAAGPPDAICDTQTLAAPEADVTAHARRRGATASRDRQRNRGARIRASDE